MSQQKPYSKFNDFALHWLEQRFDYGERFNVSMSKKFSLEGLALCKNRGEMVHGDTNYPVFDHCQWVKGGRYPFALISHSYASRDEITDVMRKVQLQHPELVALYIQEDSWWLPEMYCTPLIILRREDHMTLWNAYCVTRLPNSDRRRPALTLVK